MAVAARKYNPGFLLDDELVTSFCVRTQEFESIIEMLRECTGSSIPHRIVIGPRGSGKTSLLLRVAAEVRRDADLQSGMFPIVFAEESYEVATAGEFWLECLSRLAIQAPCREGGPDLRRTVEDLRAIRDDRTLGDRCLGALQDFSDREGKRLVLMVENLDMMFRDMSDPDAGWRLRHTLQTDPRIILLASATSRFDEIDNPANALYDLFTICMLRPLDTNECAVLWESVSGRCSPPETIRSLEILTGGSPRLLAIVARFGTGLSFRELMADLLDLVDDHTEYFKGHIESLPAQERRVYLTLADLWKPATTREIADRSRLDTSKCSAQLTRLIERGVVQVAGGTARRKQYYLTERLYNIYYLLRRSRGSDRLIEVLVRFMDSYYSPRDLREFGALIADEMGRFDSEVESLHRTAFARLIDLPALAGHRQELLAMIPRGLAQSLDQELSLANTTKTAPSGARPDEGWFDARHVDPEESTEFTAARALLDRAVTLEHQHRTQDALAAFTELVHRFEESERPAVLELVTIAFLGKVLALVELNRLEEALGACDEVVHRTRESDAPEFEIAVTVALVFKGVILEGLKRPVEALTACDEALCRIGKTEQPTCANMLALALVNKGSALGALNRPQEALAAYDEVVRRFGESETAVIVPLVAKAIFNKGRVLGGLNRPEEALVSYSDVVHRFGESEIPHIPQFVAAALFHKGLTLGALNRPEETGTLSAYEEVIHRFGTGDSPVFRDQVAMALFGKGLTLRMLDRPREALDTWDDAVCRFEENEPARPRVLAELVLLEKADLELALRQYKSAIGTADRLLDRCGMKSLENRCRGRLIRAKAILASGEPPACKQDLEALLAILPELGSLPRTVLDGLVMLSVDLGPARMHELILSSPAASLLLPLTTALAWEIGLEPRVPQEVEEVARDIRRDLAKLRDSAFRAIVPAFRDSNSPPPRRGPR